MNLEKYVRMFSAGDGMVRVIDPEGNVIVKKFRPDGGTPIDFCFSRICSKTREDSKEKGKGGEL